MTTSYTHDRDGHRACSVYDLENQKQLHITTSKSGKALVTRATVHRVEGDLLRHIFGFGSTSGDYSNYLACSHPSRVTIQAVRLQHERCLSGLQYIKREIKTHYEAQAAANV